MKSIGLQNLFECSAALFLMISQEIYRPVTQQETQQEERSALFDRVAELSQRVLLRQKLIELLYQEQEEDWQELQTLHPVVSRGDRTVETPWG